MITPTVLTAPGPAAPSAGERPAVTARRARMITLAVLAAATTAALTACGTSYPLAPVASPPVAPVASTATEAGTAVGAASDPAASDPAAPGSGAPGSGAPGSGAAGSGPASGRGTGPVGRPAGGGGHGSTTGGTSGGGHSGGGQGSPAAPGPAIASFRVVSRPVCAVHGTPDAPFSTPGSGVTIAWSVTGADGAALAVDNPTTYGAYGTSYPAKGQQELPFTCEPGTTTSHTFTVWPAGAKGTSKTLTVSAHSDG